MIIEVKVVTDDEFVDSRSDKDSIEERESDSKMAETEPENSPEFAHWGM